jgi:uncharacterized protein DUF6049
MRRLLIPPIALLLAGVGWLQAPVASAQAPAPVVLRLVSQSVWNGPGRPLNLSFSATNTGGAPLEALSVVLIIRAPARSRSAYELSLRSDQTPVVSANSIVERGALQPGEARTFRISQSLDALTARGESALYPVQVEVLSNDAPVGILRTPMIFLIEPPEVPLNFAWSWVLSTPVQLAPDGSFVPGPLEGDIAPGGRIRAMADALDRPKGGPVDVAVSPVLVDQLARMANGYRVGAIGGPARAVPKGRGGSADAAEVLDSLRTVAARSATELTALPFGDPSLPAVLQAGLQGDLPRLADEGTRIVGEGLSAEPVRDVIRPPYSRLDTRSLDALAARGARVLLLDPSFVPPPAEPTFNPSPVAKLTHGGSSALAVVPDPGVAAIVDTYTADPILAARAGLGELAAIWFEFPGTPGRGAAVLFRESPEFPPEFYQSFSTLVRASPWLRRVTAARLADRVAPRIPQPLPSRSYRPLSPAYVGRLVQTRHDLGTFGQTMQGSSDLVGRLEDGLLLAEGGTFITDPDLGERYIEAAEATMERTYDRVQISASVPVTLTSQTGVIPVRVRNDSRFRAKVLVRLVPNPRLSFPQGSAQTVTLGIGSQTLLFRVRAQTTGHFPVLIQIQTLTPAPETIAETQLIVRSTAYNRVALILTIGAALFLFGWWGRRFLPRRKS